MGYKMPNVVKEIYLPINPDEDGAGLTIEQYKEKYGIDLKELFVFNTRDFQVKCNKIAKLYVVNIGVSSGSDFSSLISNKVIPVTYFKHSTDGEVTSTRIGVYDPDEGEVVGIIIHWNRVNNEINILGAIL